MKSPNKNINTIVKVLITCGFLAYVLYLIPLQTIVEALKTTNPVFFMAAILISVVKRYINSYQFSLFARHEDIKISTRQIFEIDFITQFYNFFLPGHLASGVLRWHRLSKVGKKPAQLLGVIVFNRILELFIIVSIGFLAFLIEPPPYTTPFLFYLFSGLLGSLIVVLYLTSTDLSRLEDRLKKYPLLKAEFIWKAARSLKVFHKYSSLMKMKIIGLGLLKHCVGLVSFMFFASALDLPISMVTIAIIRSTLLIVNLFPVSFSGIGVRDVSLVLLLVPYGVSSAEAVALSFIILGRSIMMSIVGGFLELVTIMVQHRNSD